LEKRSSALPTESTANSEALDVEGFTAFTKTESGEAEAGLINALRRP